MAASAESRQFKEAFEQGESQFQARDYGAAIAQFKAADVLRPTAEVAYDLAKCHEKLGNRADTAYYYRLYLRRAPQATDALEVAERIGVIVAAMEADGQGLLELEAPGAEAISVLGERIAEIPFARFLPPGDYEIEVHFPHVTEKTFVQLLTGKITMVSVEPSRPRLVPLSAPAPQLALTEQRTAAPSPLRIGSYVAAGIGAAALLAGIAVGASSAIDGAASQKRETPFSQAQDLADAANSKGLSANLLFGIGGAAVAGGVLMFVFSMPEPGHATGSLRLAP